MANKKEAIEIASHRRMPKAGNTFPQQKVWENILSAGQNACRAEIGEKAFRQFFPAAAVMQEEGWTRRGARIQEDGAFPKGPSPLLQSAGKAPVQSAKNPLFSG